MSYSWPKLAEIIPVYGCTSTAVKTALDLTKPYLCEAKQALRAAYGAKKAMSDLTT